MNKILTLLMGLVLAANLQANDIVRSTFSESADGTRSATAFVPKGAGFANVTDISYRLDSGATTATIDIQRAEKEHAVTSATTSTAVLWFDNDPAAISLSEYVIIYDESSNSYSLTRCSATASTSATVYSTQSLTTSDKVYSCLATVRRHAPEMVTETVGSVNIWLPSDLPSALTLDGNTTSCRISVDGRRISY
jgi:hypothetical protein